MHYLYILYSKKLSKYYIGQTYDLKKRLQNHNKGLYKTSFTKASNDWEYVLIKSFPSKQEALILERFIKRMKSKILISKIIQDPTILDKIKI